MGEVEAPRDGDDETSQVSLAQDETSVSAGHYFRNLAIAGVALVVVCGAIIGLSNRGTDESSSEDISSRDEESAVVTTAPPDSDELCIEELSEWLPWVTGPGSTMDAAAEWGMQGEEYRIVLNGWSEFQRQVYQVGNDEASALAYGEIARGCRAMTYDYEPGHLPPG
jgi:hypothetical protein